jgi:hypothetical protein
LEEWQAPDDLDRESAFQRWTTARRAWVAEHPDSALGNRLDLLRGERRARFGNLGWHQSDVVAVAGNVMATHRRVVEFQPPKLLTFNPEDWQSRQQWQDARFQWLLAHPWQTLDGSDVIDVIFQT